MQALASLSVLAELSSGQWGMFTAAQAGRRGVSRLVLSRLAADGHVERLAHGVYRDAGAPGDERDQLRATWLAIRPASTAEERLSSDTAEAVVCGATAAWLHGLGTQRPEPYELSAPGRLQTRRTDVRFRRRTLDRAGFTIVGGLPTTTVAQTVADLVAWRTDLSIVGDVVADAVRAGVLDTREAAARLAPLARRHGLPLNDGAALLARLMRIGGVDPHAVAARTARSAIGGLVAAEYTAAVARQLQAIAVPDQLIEQIAALSVALGPVEDAQRAIGESLRQTLVPMTAAMRQELEASESVRAGFEAMAAQSQAMSRQIAESESVRKTLVPMAEATLQQLTQLAPLLESVAEITRQSEALTVAVAKAAS